MNDQWVSPNWDNKLHVSTMHFAHTEIHSQVKLLSMRLREIQKTSSQHHYMSRSKNRNLTSGNEPHNLTTTTLSLTHFQLHNFTTLTQLLHPSSGRWAFSHIQSLVPSPSSLENEQSDNNNKKVPLTLVCLEWHLGSLYTQGRECQLRRATCEVAPERTINRG